MQIIRAEMCSRRRDQRRQEYKRNKRLSRVTGFAGTGYLQADAFSGTILGTATLSSLREQKFQVFSAQVPDQAVIGADNRGGQIALGLL